MPGGEARVVRHSSCKRHRSARKIYNSKTSFWVLWQHVMKKAVACLRQWLLWGRRDQEANLGQLTLQPCWAPPCLGIPVAVVAILYLSIGIERPQLLSAEPVFERVCSRFSKVCQCSDCVRCNYEWVVFYLRAEVSWCFLTSRFCC